MIDPRIFIGKPIKFGDFFIYPPKVGEVIENREYPQYIQLLTSSQEDINDLVKDKLGPDGKPISAPTPFELLMINAHSSPQMLKITEEAFLFFTHEEVRIIPAEKVILFLTDIDTVTSVDDLRMLREEDFFDFQNKVRESIGDKKIEALDPDEDPRVSRIKAKARERERVKKKINAKNGISLTTSLASLCCMGIGITPLNIGEISYASLNLLVQTYQEQEKYRNDILMISGGADPKKINPEYWIRNLNN